MACISRRTIAALLIFTFPVIAQNVPDATPSLKSRTELVLIPVVVSQKGEAVRGLSKTDFTILHEGKPEKVAIFEDIEAATAKVERVQHSENSVQNYARSDNRQDVVILLLDYLNGSWATNARINGYLSEVAQQLSAAKTPATVLLLSTKGLVQAHSFTTDMQSFVKAVQRLGTEEGRKATRSAAITANWATPLDDTTDNLTAATFRDFALTGGFIDQMKLDKAQMTQQALEQLAEAYRGIPGRKKLIWVSTGFPVGLDATGISESRDPNTEFRIQEKARRAWRALSNANISVYPVDSNGVTNPTWDKHFNAANGASSSYVRRSNETVSNIYSLMEIAQRTGGKLCTDNPAECTKKAVVDEPHYYMLGFYLDKDATAKQGWHKLKVKVNQPDMNVRARGGFYVGDHMKDAPQEDKDQVLTALASPLDYTSVPLRLSWTVGSIKGQRAIEYTLNSPPGGVSVSADDSALHVDILAYVRSVGAADGSSFPASLNTKVTAAQQEGLNKTGFQFRKHIPLMAGRYELRLLVRDNVSGKLGTVSTIIDVPGK